MGLAHMFLFLYKHNSMCSIYTRDFPYSFFSFNRLDFDFARCKLSQDNSGLGWAKSTQVHVELSRPGPSRIESVWTKVDPSHFGPKLSRVNPGPSRAEWPILSRLESVGTDIKPSWPMPMSSRAGPSPCWAESFRSDIESSKPGPISSRPSQS